jgi:NAD(P)-dependent dehydrogenase (short-subunit alcohol dehydrogenase family)
MLTLEGKTAVVTGGGSGIGAAIVTRFVQQGAKVAILDLDLSKAQKLIEDTPTLSSNIFKYQVDVSNGLQVKQVMDQVISDLGKVDILVNNAGVSQIGALDSTTEEDFDRVFSVNAKGVYNCLHALIAHMMDRRQGVILNMASVAATVGISDRFAYSATKGAVRSMTFSVAKDYLDYNIRCNCISPARVHTPFVDDYLRSNYPGKEQEVYQQLAATQPIGRMGTPEEIANLALYLCSDEAGFITGTDYPIDGGFITLNT